MSLTLEKIFEAKNRIAPYTTRTPLIRLEKLDEYLGCQVYLKAECMQITGAFKLRGAVNKIRMLTHDKRMNDCLPPILFSAIFKLLKVLPDTELDAC